MDKPLFKHQERDVQRILARPEEILNFSDPGTGKTRVHIEAIRRALEQGRTGKTLVFAPKSILQAAWGNDIDQFAPEIRYVTAFADNRDKAFKIDADVYLVNHDGVNWFTERKGNGKYGLTSEARRLLKDFDRLIIDESTAFKSPTSQRSKSMQAVAEVMAERAVMTGTFTPNGLVDAWHQVYLVDGGKRLGAKFTQFRDSVCRRIADKNDSRFSRWEDKPGIHPVVNELLKDITIRNKREDVLELPPNQVITVPFDLTPRHRHYYESLLDEKLLELDSGTVSAFNAAVLVQKLLQVTSGAVYTRSGEYQLLSNERTELILELAQSHKQALIAYTWQHQLDALIKAADKAKLSYGMINGKVNDKYKERAVNEFQAGNLQMMFLHPASAAHGLTLTNATATIWASPTYNAEHYEQLNARFYRHGQTQKTITYLIAARNTLETQVYQKLKGKLSLMDILMSLIHQSQKKEAA